MFCYCCFSSTHKRMLLSCCYHVVPSIPKQEMTEQLFHNLRFRVINWCSSICCSATVSLLTCIPLHLGPSWEAATSSWWINSPKVKTDSKFSKKITIRMYLSSHHRHGILSVIHAYPQKEASLASLGSGFPPDWLWALAEAPHPHVVSNMPPFCWAFYSVGTASNRALTILFPKTLEPD